MFYFLKKCFIPGLELQTLQQSHYTIHLQFIISSSLSDYLLINAVIWKDCYYHGLAHWRLSLFFFHVLTSVTFCMVSFQQALSISPHLTQRDISSQSEYYLHRLSYSSPKQNELTTQNFCITSSNDIFLFSILRSNNL